MITRSIFAAFLISFSWSAALSQHHDSPAGLHFRGFGFIAGGKNIRLNKTCGVYRTPEDRQSGMLSLEIDCTTDDHRTKPGFVGDKAAVRITRADKTQLLFKSDLYGYRDCSGNEIHFFDGKSYELLNPGEPISFYRIFEWRGKQRIAKHFFSARSENTVKPLTWKNLTTDFSNEPEFIEKLQNLAKNDFELVKYLYAINRIRMNTQEPVL